MHLHQYIGSVLVVVAAFALTSCGSESGGSSNDDKAAAEESSTSSSPDAEPSEPEPTGTLATKPVPCKKLAAPAGFQQSGAMPPIMCAIESRDARVTIEVGPGPQSFEQLQQVEQAAAQSKGVAPPAIEQVDVDGWTVAARWPEVGGFNRIDRYLVDSAGTVLTCKVGVQGAPVDPGTHAEVCDSARDLLYTP